MPGLPKIVKFRGDNDQSFRTWILELEAQLTALGHEKSKWRDLILCACEGKAFQEITAQVAKSDGKITYDELKKSLITTFSGPDYSRTLQAKLRGLVFTKGMKINAYATEPKTVISELYEVSEEKAINHLAINHIISTLDSEMREQVHILQLTGSATPEGILELVETKMRSHPFPRPETASASASAAESDRLGRLERVVESLASQVSRLSTGSSSWQQETTVCEHCQKPGHIKSRCFKLKKCYLCSKFGHIAKHCRNSNNQGEVSTSSGETGAKNSVNSVDFVALQSSPRIYLDLNVGGSKLDFLYYPGSQYSMVPKNIYDQLPNKPPLSAVNKVGMGISGRRFEFDGVCHMSLSFSRPDKSVYVLEYEPLLLSTKINTCIFGIHTERRFKGGTRDHDEHVIKFIPRENKAPIAMPYVEEKSSTPRAFIQVAKVTIVPENEVAWIKGKVKGLSRNEDKQFLFEGSSNENSLEFADIQMHGEQRTVAMPVFNTSDSAIKLRKGECLGNLTELDAERVIDVISVDLENTANASTTQLSNMSADATNSFEEKLHKIVNSYKQRMENIPKTYPAKVPVKHSIDLKDDVPVYENPRCIAYSQRGAVKDVIDDLLQKGFIRESQSPYGACVIPVLKKNGQIRLCIDYRRLNQKTIPRQYLIPRTEDLLEKNEGGQVFHGA